MALAQVKPLENIREQVSEEEWALRVDLAAAFRLVAYFGWDDLIFLPKKELLSLEELDRMCSAFVGLGVRKLRLTG